MNPGSQIGTRNLNLDSLLHSESDIVYFKTFLESTGVRESGRYYLSLSIIFINVLFVP